MSNSKSCVSIDMHLFLGACFCVSNVKNLAKKTLIKNTHTNRLDSATLGRISPDYAQKSPGMLCSTTAALHAFWWLQICVL